LPPSIILEVMRILHEEMGLREETRTLELAKAAVTEQTHAERSEQLAQTQQHLATRVHNVTDDIRDQPEGAAKFDREIALLTRVKEVMLEAHQWLASHDTGSATIAAETEAIELLLQSRRINPKGGGGSGSSPGGGGTGLAEQPALALLGRGDEEEASVVSRHVHQSTGTGGEELPAEYRRGLDAFFEALERGASSTTN